MKMNAAFVSLALLIGVSAGLDAATLKIDPAHSTVGFKIRHLFANVTGRFKDVKGTINVDPEHPENASVEATIGIGSIDTAEPKRDTHLKSPDFFDAEKYPDMVYKSSKVTMTGKDEADVAGDLTMHGVTKPVTLHVKFLGKGAGMMGGTTTGWEATGKLKRSDYGLTWSKAIEGTQVVADEVELEFEITADAEK